MSAATLLAPAAGVVAAAAIVDLAALAGGRRAAAGGPTPGRRVVLACVALAARLGLRVTPPADLPAQVAGAGLVERAVAEVAAVKAGAALLGATLALPVAAAAPGRLWLVVVPGLPVLGWLAPDRWLVLRRRRRVALMEAEAAEVLDLVRVATGAGLPAPRAFAEVARRHRGLLAAELGLAAEQVALGVRRREALARLARRCPIPAVDGLVAALDRAERHGSPLASALASLAADARSERSRRIKDHAARAAPKIQLVVALLLVPAVMLVVGAALVARLL